MSTELGKIAYRGDMAKDGPGHYTRAMLHKAFTGEPSEYAHSEARKHHMSIADFMARYDKPGAQRTRERERKTKKARDKARANGFTPGRRKEQGAQRDV